MNEDQYCTPEQQEERVSICKTCPRFWISEENKTYCLEANKSISYMIAETATACPLEKW